MSDKRILTAVRPPILGTRFRVSGAPPTVSPEFERFLVELNDRRTPDPAACDPWDISVWLDAPDDLDEGPDAPLPLAVTPRRPFRFRGGRRLVGF